MEHDALARAFLIGGLAAMAAAGSAAVMLVWWVRGRRRGRPVVLAGVGFVVCAAIAGTSASWLAQQRHEKCGPTVARTLCESPVDWLRQ